MSHLLWLDQEHLKRHCQRKINYLPVHLIGVSPPLLSHGFLGSIQADPRHIKYLEFSSDNAGVLVAVNVC